MESGVPIFLDTIGAAAHLGLSTSTLEKWRVSGAGPRYCKHGRSVRYLRADLDAWSEAQTTSRRDYCDRINILPKREIAGKDGGGV
jgi:predicted DNA-binding transcriptional regulator AlpA